MLNQTLQGIESAQADIEIHKALKEGDAVLKDLHAKVSIDDWEELYEDHKENMKMHDMEVEMFGEALKDEDLLADLDQLEAEEAAKEMADPTAGVIDPTKANEYREKHGLNEPEQPAAA